MPNTTPNKKKILQFIPRHDISGGAERVAIQLGEILEEQGYIVKYLTLYKGSFATESDYCLNYKDNLWSRTIGVLTSTWVLYRHIKKEKIDIVISHLPRPNHANAICAFFSSAKHFGVAHNRSHNGKLNELAMRLLWWKLDKIVCVSHGVEQAVRMICKDNTTTIYNPFNFTEIQQKAAKPLSPADQKIFQDPNLIYILQIARFVPQKNHQLAIGAFAAAYKQNQRLRLILTSDGPLLSTIQDLVYKYNLQDVVHFIGVRENIFPLIAKADYVLLSSNHEGLPTVLIEALVVGTPVVSTDCKSGPREIIAPDIDLETPLIYPYQNTAGYLVADSTTNCNRVLEQLSNVLSCLGKNQSTNIPLISPMPQFQAEQIVKQWEDLFIL